MKRPPAPRLSNGKLTPEYVSWCRMRNRCNNKNAPQYQWYGGRGISICARWEYFPAFLEDMGPKPSPRHTLDRIDNDGNYEPNNCRWATAKEQARNSRKAHNVTLNGETRCIAEWTELTGLKGPTIRHRLRHGYDVASALSPEAKLRGVLK